MNLAIGADVIGADGKLGEISRVIVDARTDRVTDIVVRTRRFFGSERVVPIVHVARVGDDGVHLDLDERAFGTMDGYADERRDGVTDYVGTPGHDLDGTFRGNLTLDAAVAFGAAGYGAGKPLGYPGGERLERDFRERPALTKGMPVLAADGEKVGEIGELQLSAETGAPTRIVLERGILFNQDVDLPLEWVQDLTHDGVLLSVPKGEVEALAHGASNQ
ncbi:MAG: PRC-barrel domain-containing protein [Dehalococcoidia bacterium]